jgi:two-component system, LuxR family, sensor kinase FixL
VETDLLLENLPGLAYRCEVAPPWRMDYVSPGARQLCGYPAEDLLDGRVDWASIVHPQDLAPLEAELANAVAERRGFELVYRIVTAEGVVRWVHEKGQPVSSGQDGIAALVGFIMNITVEDLAGRTGPETLIVNRPALQRSAEAELQFLSHQSAMGTMAATLAHELNQPLSAITFFAAALRRAIPEAAAGPRTGEALSLLEANALRAAEIIRRLRDAVRAGAPRRERFACKQLVEEALAFTSIGCEQVRFDLDLGNGEVEGADRVQIQQVVVNLIRNACEAVSGRGDARVSIVSEPRPGPPPMVRVSVCDNGPGIPDDVLPRLFDTRLSTKPSGMGLGLSISRTIIEAHGGRIWAENGGEGACFRFEIPVGRAIGR